MEKVCSKCHRTLPETSFYKRSKSADGLQLWCKECTRESARARAGHKKATAKAFVPSSAKKVWHLPELACVSNKDLIAELKARGFRGSLKYEYEINV